MSGINPLVWRAVGAIGGLLALSGALSAWATDPRFDVSLNGTAFTEGKWLLGFAIIALLMIGWRHIAGDDAEAMPWTERVVSLLGVSSVSRNAKGWAWVDSAVSVLGLVMFIIAVVKWVDLSGSLHEEANVGAGMFIALVGTLGLIVSGIHALPGLGGYRLVKDEPASTDDSGEG